MNLSKYSYATQFLAERKIGIYQGDKQILLYTGKPNYDVVYPNTGFYSGMIETIEKEKEYEEIKKYADLIDIGFCIKKKQIRENEKSFKLQKRRLVLVIYESGMEEDPDWCDRLPPEHKIFYDTEEKRAILIGKNAGKDVKHFGIGEWVYLHPKVTWDVKKKLTINDWGRGGFNKIWDEQYERSSKISLDKDVFIEIPELPTMITDAREIICIPNLKDQPTIYTCGKKGSGKSYLLHGLIDRARTKFNVMIANINDSQGETDTWCLPNDKDVLELARLNEFPAPLPMAYLHPTIDFEYDMVYPKEVGFEISLPFKNMIRYPERYVDLKGSGKYFESLREKILKIKTIKEGEKLIELNDIPNESKRLLKNYIQLIFNRRLTDINGVPSVWKISKNNISYEYNPILASMLAGLVPSLQTGSILNIKFFPEYYRYFVEDIFEKQKNDPLFIKNKLKTWLLCDEMLNIANKKKSTRAEEIFTRVVTEGRIRNIGTLGAAHEFSLLPERVADNVIYFFTFLNPGEASYISSFYGFSNRIKNTIKKGLGIGECIAYTDLSYFVVYDLEGNRSKQKGPFKGQILPTISMHKSPSGGI